MVGVVAAERISNNAVLCKVNVVSERRKERKTRDKHGESIGTIVGGLRFAFDLRGVHKKSVALFAQPS
jgi:hypothetical protein